MVAIANRVVRELWRRLAVFLPFRVRAAGLSDADSVHSEHKQRRSRKAFRPMVYASTLYSSRNATSF